MIRRHFKQRFGITARKVAVRTEAPWHWRAMIWVGVISLSLALSFWMYDAGRRIAGFDRGETERELDALRQSVKHLEIEIEALRGTSSSSDSRLLVEQSTQQQLAAQIRGLQRENAALKEELALFEGLVAAGQPQVSGPRIARVRVEPTGREGRYRYRVLVVNSGMPKAAREAQGELQFEFTLRQDGKDVSISVPGQGVDSSAFRFAVKHFQRLEGEFELPARATPKAGEIRLVQGGMVRTHQPISF